MKTETVKGLKRFRLRLIVLGVLGVFHGVLFFVGDILFGCALMGTVLTLVLQKTDSLVKKLGAWMGSIALLFYVAIAFMPSDPTTDALTRQYDRMMTMQSFWGAAMERSLIFPQVAFALFFVNFF